MIRYGVNVPEASWVMSIGVGSCELAMRMASDYRRQADRRTYADFLAWIRALDLETLRQRYKVEGSVLRETSKIISRTGTNSWLAAQQPIRDVLPIRTEVAGVRYGKRRQVAQAVTRGSIVSLDREYENLLDRNAILVHWEDKELGYLPAPLAQFLAPEIDTGLSLSARVLSVGSRQIPRVTVEIHRPQ